MCVLQHSQQQVGGLYILQVGWASGCVGGVLGPLCAPLGVRKIKKNFAIDHSDLRYLYICVFVVFTCGVLCVCVFLLVVCLFSSMHILICHFLAAFVNAM